MLSHSCKSAIKAVVYLSANSESLRKATIKEIAISIDVSEHTLGKLLQLLVKKKIICSEKGPSGGFYITKQQMKLPIIEIIEAIDGAEVFKSCALGLSKCSSTKPCALHDQYKEARELMINMFTKNRISEMGNSVQSGLSYLTN